MRKLIRKKVSAAVLALLLLLPGCAAGTSASSTPSAPSTSSEPSSESSPSSAPSAAAPNARVPLEDWVYIASFADPPPEDIPQLVCKDDTAARLARAIQPLIGFGMLPFFDSENPLDPDAAARIAFDNTRRISLAISYHRENGVHCDDYPDHPITKRLTQIWEEDGDLPCDVIYADDAAAALERLFGITDWEPHTVSYYNYFPEEGIYVTYGDLIRGKSYPQLLSWEETETGYTCEIIIINPMFNTVGSDIEVNEENIAEIAALIPHYTFTFDMTSGEPVVTSFAKSQEGLTDKAQPLVDDYMWSGTPKAQAVGPITTARLHREIPQYQYENGVLTPVTNSSHYPVSADGKVFGIFIDNHDDQLGNTWSFSSEYADELKAFSEDNDQVCVVYDDIGAYFLSPAAREMFRYGPGFSEEKFNDPSLDHFQNAQVDLSNIEFYPTQHTPSWGGLYFEPETWAENWASWEK